MASDDGDNLRQAVFGANDGLVSTFGLVAGLIGAGVPQYILILANVVNMFAAGMSMGFGTYIATKSQVELNKKLAREERRRIREDRRAALRELRELFRRRGVKEKDLKRHIDPVIDNEEEWLQFVMEQKHGVAQASFPNPVKGGAIMFFTFILCGLIPIVPLFFATGLEALALSAAFTATALFFVGALKQRLTGRSWLSLGLENLLIGAVTGTVGFVAGIFTGQLLGV